MTVQLFWEKNQESLQAIKKNIGRSLISIYGTCVARFEGTAASKLGKGSRVLLIKKDKAVLLHGLEGMKPINWQNKNSALTIKEIGDDLIIRAESRSKRGFYIEVVFKEIECIVIYSGDKGEKINLIGTESDLVDFLETHPDLIEPGFTLLKRERQTEFGYIDLLGIDKNGQLTIVEVKRRTAGTKDIQQLRRYIEAVGERKKTSVRGIIMAPAIGDKAKSYLKSFQFEFKQVNLEKIISELKQEPPKSSLDKYLEE